MRTKPRRGRQTLCHQYQSEEILSETLNKILKAKTSNQIRHLLDQFGRRSLQSSIVDTQTQTSSSRSAEPIGVVNSLASTSSSPSVRINQSKITFEFEKTPSPSLPPPSLSHEQSNRYCLRKPTRSSVHSKSTGKIAAVVTAAVNRNTKNHSSGGNDVNTNCINANDDIDWYIELASKCYTDGFLSHVNHLDECTRPRSAVTNETKLQRQHNTHTFSSAQQSSVVCNQPRQTKRRPLKPLRSTNLFSTTVKAVRSVAANERVISSNIDDKNATKLSNSSKIGDSRRLNRNNFSRSGVAAKHSGILYADENMNRGVAIDAKSAQGLQHLNDDNKLFYRNNNIGYQSFSSPLPQPSSQQHQQQLNHIDDQNNKIKYADDRMNFSPTTANRVNDLINSFYTLNLAAADDNSLPQIILTDFSNNSLQPTTTPLFSSTIEHILSAPSSTTSHHPVVVGPNASDSDNATDHFIFDNGTLLTNQQQFVAEDFNFPETKSQPQFTFNDADFSPSPNYYQFDTNGSRSFESN